jgi:hypothetical protein
MCVCVFVCVLGKKETGTGDTRAAGHAQTGLDGQSEKEGWSGTEEIFCMKYILFKCHLYCVSVCDGGSLFPQWFSVCDLGA